MNQICDINTAQNSKNIGRNGNIKKNKNNKNIKKNKPKPGDWFCTKCNNMNFAFRTICNRCHMQK